MQLKVCKAEVKALLHDKFDDSGELSCSNSVEHHPKATTRNQTVNKVLTRSIEIQVTPDKLGNLQESGANK